MEMWDYKVTEISPGMVYEIRKPDGTIYTVQRDGGREFDPWICDCPAGKHRHECKHFGIVAEFILKGGSR